MGQPPAFDGELARLLAASEPAELRNFFAVPEVGRPLHVGTVAPILGVHREASDRLVIPASVAEEASPFDYAGAYLTHEELTGTKSDFHSIAASIAQYDRSEILSALGSILLNLHQGEEWTARAPRAAAGLFREPYGSLCRHLLDQRRQLFSRHGALVLAKIALAHGGTSTDSGAPRIEWMLTLLFTKIHDHLGRRPAGADGDTVRVDGQITPLAAYLTANHIFNRAFDEASFIYLYQQRWNNPARPAATDVKGRFKQAMGYEVQDQAELALAVWSGARGSGHVFHSRSAFESAGFDTATLDRMLGTLSKPISEVRELVREVELGGIDLEWNFDTMERYPLIGMEDGTYLALEPAHLVRRCMGWAPVYDLGRKRNGSEHSMAMTSEACTFEVLEAMYDAGPLSRRLFSESELKALAPDSRCADAAVDFGGSFVVIEITARRTPRDVVHGKSTDALNDLLDMVLDELEQIAGTARALQTERHHLTGVPSTNGIRIYPVVIMVEGFPTSPVTLSEIRAMAENQALFKGLPVGPIEVIDLVELEMLEAVMEVGGPSLPDLLDAKEASNFKYDSLRNYLHSRADIDLHVPQRVSDGILPAFARLLARLQAAEADVT